jgi:outer membrane protein OmpA-like peptidoglycan-associated protein
LPNNQIMFPQGRKVSGRAAILGVAIGILLASPTSTASAASLPDYPCESSVVEARYISPEDLGRLRTLRQQATPSAPFLDLVDDDLPIVDEVLRVGPSAGFYAARLLRDLAILEAFEQQAQCDPKQHCHKPEIIAGFPVQSANAADESKIWQALIRDWKEFRNRDAARSRACLAISRTRPTYEILVVIGNEPKPLPAKVNLPVHDDHGVTCRRQMQMFVANRPIHFASGRAVVRREDRQFLADVAERIGACKETRIAIVGHTDSDGARRYNQRLSQERAEAVAKILMKDIAVHQRLLISGLGESSPAKPNTTRANKAYNRRVVIWVL